MRACGVHPDVEPEISRFPRKELPHMPGSSTTPGRTGARDNAPSMLPSVILSTSAPGTHLVFAAQWLAYALPCRRFADTLTDACARLGADVDRYSLIVVDLHHLLFAGSTGAPADQGVTLPVRYDRNSHPQNRRIGYARVNTYGQTVEAQLEQLRGAGCTKIYREKVTGARFSTCSYTSPPGMW
jgi:hypothetical protein